MAFQGGACVFAEVIKTGNHVANTTALTHIRMTLFFFHLEPLKYAPADDWI